MKRLLAAFVVLVLGLGTSAPAAEIDWTGPDVTADARVAWSLDIARQWWGPNPRCPFGPTVTTYDDPDPDNAGRAEMPGCHIWLDRTFMNGGRIVTWMVCGLLVHEYGHNMGHDHSDNPMDVMYPVLDGVPNRCHRWHKEHPRPKRRRYRWSTVDARSSVPTYRSTRTTLTLCARPCP